MRTFKEYVQTANGAMNEEELFRIYLAAVARRGLDRGMFVSGGRSPHFGQARAVA